MSIYDEIHMPAVGTVTYLATIPAERVLSEEQAKQAFRSAVTAWATGPRTNHHDAIAALEGAVPGASVGSFVFVPRV